MSLWPPGAREFAAGERVARLATAGGDLAPHAVPICFAIVGDRLYTVVDQKPKRNPLGLKRLRNIRENARVAVVIDRYDEDWSKLAYVLLRGRATIVEDADEYGRALDALRAKYAQYADVKLSIGHNPLVRVEVEKVNYWTGAGGSS